MSRCCTWFADNNVCLPHAGMCELFDRTPVTRRMIILRRADHMHFRDNAEEMDESVRNMTFPEELSWILREMRPIAELSSGEQAHLFVRGLTLADIEATLKQTPEARRFLEEEIEGELAAAAWKRWNIITCARAPRSSVAFACHRKAMATGEPLIVLRTV
jgi:hypothetical protein